MPRRRQLMVAGVAVATWAVSIAVADTAHAHGHDTSDATRQTITEYVDDPSGVTARLESRGGTGERRPGASTPPRPSRAGSSGGTGGGGSTGGGGGSSGGGPGPCALAGTALGVSGFVAQGALLNQLCQLQTPGPTTPVSSHSPSTQSAPAMTPAQLRAEALARLEFPLPQPQVEAGIAAQLATFLGVSNTAESATASDPDLPGVAGSVTATPVRQRWEVTWQSGPSDAVECAVGERCEWTPRHSSAGEPARSDDGRPCVPTTVTVVWDVEGTTTEDGVVTEVVPLDDATTVTEACLVISEIQALHTFRGGGR